MNDDELEERVAEYPCRTLHETENLDVTVDYENGCHYILTKKFHFTIWESYIDVTPNRSGVVDTNQFIESSIHIKDIRLDIGSKFFFNDLNYINEDEILKKVEKISIYVTFS